MVSSSLDFYTLKKQLAKRVKNKEIFQHLILSLNVKRCHEVLYLQFCKIPGFSIITIVQ